MDIVLINTNSIVSKLIQLCATKTGFVLNTMESLKVEYIKKDDIVIIDDGVLTTAMKNILQNSPMGYKVLLASKDLWHNDTDIFDDIVYKPFMPSHIVDMLTNAHKRLKNDMAHKKTNKKLSTKVLDEDELQKIKNILEQTEEEFFDIDNIEERKLQAFKEHLESDGIEVTNEDEYIKSITKKPKKYKKALKKLIDNAIDDIIKKVGKDSFKQAIKDGKVNLKFKVKEI
jgi:sulfur transfer complex TusBCD TusB component (DsrH family)